MANTPFGGIEERKPDNIAKRLNKSSQKRTLGQAQMDTLQCKKLIDLAYLTNPKKEKNQKKGNVE